MAEATGGLRCVLVDDDAAVLQALAGFLDGQKIEIIGQAGSGLEALRMLESLPQTVVVLDLRLQDMDGIELSRRAAEILRRKTAVVTYTSWAEPKEVQELLDGGARAVVIKDVPPRNLLAAIDEVAAGRIYVDPQLTQSATVD